MPPSEMPVAEMLCATARRSTNQRVRMELMVTDEEMPYPIASSV